MSHNQNVEIPALDCSKLKSDPAGWLLEQKSWLGKEYWVLAFALDGVTWGQVKGGELRTGAPLDASTLREVYAFCPAGQAHAWRQADGWHAANTLDRPGQDCFDQELLLWGNRLESYADGFATLSEGAQGIRHTVPLTQEPRVKADRSGSPRLRVRHMLGKDANGAASIVATRLVELVE